MGFSKTRRAGSHERWNHPDGRAVTIPLHGGREIGPPLFFKILRQLGVPWNNFDDCDSGPSRPGDRAKGALLLSFGAIIRRMKKPAGKARLREFTVVIEQDEDGYYVASVPALHSCYTQARTLEELAPRIREVIALCLAEQKAPRMKFVGVQQVEVSA